MRVLGVGSIYPPHHLGGYEIIWRGVMRRLREDGHDVRVLATDFRRDEVAADAAEDPDVHRELDWYWRDHQWRRLGLRQRLAIERRNAATFDRHLREFEPDAITWWLLGGMSLSLIEQARRAGVPATFFVLDYWLSYGRDRDLWTRMWRTLSPLAPLAERLTGLPTRIDYASAGHWVFCSETVREHALANGLRTADTTVLSPGVERSLLDAGRERDERPWRWRLLYVGRVVPQKGVLTAIKALEQLPAESQLRIVGDGDPEYRVELERLASALGVQDRVRFDGTQPRELIADVFREADAVVFPVEWAEPWGLVPLEAMALGRPVVATGRGGSGDYLRDRENSLLFEAGDAAGLARAIRTLADDRTLRERLVVGGHETATLHDEDSFNRLAAEQILGVARLPLPPARGGAAGPTPPRPA
jgi:glycogen synthase